MKTVELTEDEVNYIMDLLDSLSEDHRLSKLFIKKMEELMVVNCKFNEDDMTSLNMAKNNVNTYNSLRNKLG